ncbi:MAG: TOBE domain-containing protein [Campylobacter sp.]|nr:TOBE domain-containing protein [Campylobacter sp.]
MKARLDLELILDNGTQVTKKLINLLKAVDETGSITKAAELVGISYKNAWDSLNITNGEAFLLRSEGMKKNSGSQLSLYAKKVLEIYDNLLNAQNEFLAKSCKKLNIDSTDIKNLNRLGLNLSARNQLNATITDIKSGAVNSQIIATLPNGEILSSNITLQSQNELELELGDEILLIFKAPSVMLAKADEKLSVQNQINAEVLSVKIGAVNAQIVMKVGEQNLSAIVTNESVKALDISVGDRLKAIINEKDIIIGV